MLSVLKPVRLNLGVGVELSCVKTRSRSENGTNAGSKWVCMCAACVEGLDVPMFGQDSFYVLIRVQSEQIKQIHNEKSFAIMIIMLVTLVI